MASDSQVPIFLERLRSLFRSSETADRRDGDPNRGTAITVCVLLSFVLWLSLTLQEQRVVSVEFPVTIVDVPEGKALVQRPPSTVQAELQGSGMDLLRLAFNPPTVEVAPKGGSIDVREALSLPRANDARIESVSPNAIELRLEPRLKRRVPVRPRLNLQLAPSYELIREPSLRPDSVTVSGAESVVSPIRAWPTDSLTLRDVRDTLTREIALRDTLTGLVARSPEEVTVTIMAGKFAEETRRVEVEVTGVPAGRNLVALQPSSIQIRYRVLFDQLFASRRSSEFFATVSYSQIRSDTTGYVEPRIHVPSDLVIRDPEPIPPRIQYYIFLSNE